MLSNRNLAVISIILGLVAMGLGLFAYFMAGGEGLQGLVPVAAGLVAVFGGAYLWRR